jgi:hypothetical protein
LQHFVDQEDEIEVSQGRVDGENGLAGKPGSWAGLRSKGKFSVTLSPVRALKTASEQKKGSGLAISRCANAHILNCSSSQRTRNRTRLAPRGTSTTAGNARNCGTANGVDTLDDADDEVAPVLLA